MDAVKNTDLDEAEIAAFCRRWGIREFALFGSVLRDDFSPESDDDVLVSFKEGRKPKLADLLEMESELKAIFGRDVDLGTREAVEQDENYLRRKAILGSAQVIYEE